MRSLTQEPVNLFKTIFEDLLVSGPFSTPDTKSWSSDFFLSSSA